MDEIKNLSDEELERRCRRFRESLTGPRAFPARLPRAVLRETLIGDRFRAAFFHTQDG